MTHASERDGSWIGLTVGLAGFMCAWVVATRPWMLFLGLVPLFVYEHVWQKLGLWTILKQVASIAAVNVAYWLLMRWVEH